MTALVIAIFSIAVGVVTFVLLGTDWARVFAILRAGPGWPTAEPDRWRRVHLDADRRQPFDRRGRR